MKNSVSFAPTATTASTNGSGFAGSAVPIPSNGGFLWKRGSGGRQAGSNTPPKTSSVWTTSFSEKPTKTSAQPTETASVDLTVIDYGASLLRNASLADSECQSAADFKIATTNYLEMPEIDPRRGEALAKLTGTLTDAAADPDCADYSFEPLLSEQDKSDLWQTGAAIRNGTRGALSKADEVLRDGYEPKNGTDTDASFIKGSRASTVSKGSILGLAALGALTLASQCY